MELYNTLTRKLQLLEPINPNEISLYTCGPTVYDYQHVGNYSAFVRWDTLVRVMENRGYAVNWVMNITDVGHLTGDNEGDADTGQDRLEKGAKREGKTAWDIAKFYGQDFKDSLKELNFRQPNHLVKATDHIEQQIALIKKLEAKGFTYVIDDGVYFDSAKLADYGKLSGQKLEDLKTGARVEFNKQKRSPTDFALWKFSPTDKKRDMEWESPWGKGFPGWHLECSAMAMHYLGETIDIHAGGIDHIPVHHTNEIAQSEAATGKPFANIWLHSNHLMVEGEKIAKSSGNGVTLHDIRKLGFSALDLRLLYLQSHYRKSANFTLEGLKAARQRRLNLQAFADLRFQPVEAGTIDANTLKEIQRLIQAELQTDLRTPEALAALSDLVNSTGLVSAENIPALKHFLEFLDRIFGLDLLKSQDISDQQKQTIKQREQARAQRDFKASDQLRAQLAKDNLELRDLPFGTIWSRKNIQP